MADGRWQMADGRNRGDERQVRGGLVKSDV
jgi:hypothetical protein